MTCSIGHMTDWVESEGIGAAGGSGQSWEDSGLICSLSHQHTPTEILIVIMQTLVTVTSTGGREGGRERGGRGEGGGEGERERGREGGRGSNSI